MSQKAIHLIVINWNINALQSPRDRKQYALETD
jgi:hypothetical protein